MFWGQRDGGCCHTVPGWAWGEGNCLCASAPLFVPSQAGLAQIPRHSSSCVPKPSALPSPSPWTPCAPGGGGSGDGGSA